MTEPSDAALHAPPEPPVNEGEGNGTAARRPDAATHAFLKSGKVEPAMRDVEEALAGPEAEPLHGAEKAGRRGATTVRESAPPRKLA